MLRGGVPVDLFPFFYICITNNKDLAECLHETNFVNGPAISVLTRGRDLIHLGWRLEASPLYGNLKPNQQPYRTLVLKCQNGTPGVQVDNYSLQLIESAIAVYSDCKITRVPGDMPEDIDSDYKYVDFTLMEETLKNCGLLRKSLKRTAGR